MTTSERRIEPVERLGVRPLLRRALGLRCPACGGEGLYARPFVMRERCGHCGFVYETEQGFFLGAIYVNYAVTACLGLGAALLAEWLYSVSLVGQLAVAIPLMLLVPVLFFHHARSLWLALNVLVVGHERPAGDSR